MEKLKNEFSLIVQKYLEKNTQTPVILYSEKLILENLDFFRKYLPQVEIFFPVKVNNNTKVLQLLQTHYCNFEIASKGELDILKNIFCKSEKILYSNPVKPIQHIVEARKFGISKFTVDSIHETEKIAQLAHGAEIFIRIQVPNEGSQWKLNSKFGASASMTQKIADIAIKSGLLFSGLSFHVGWNNTNLNTWTESCRIALEITDKLSKKGIDVRKLNLGGGFPAHRVDSYAHFSAISKSISPYITEFRKRNMQLIAEPGSFLVANSGVLLTRIFHKEKRNRRQWLFVDSCAYNGFYWKLAGLQYDIFPLNNNNSNKVVRYIITGPTCDSQEVFSYNALLPASIDINDLLLIHPAGAYIESAQHYNGFGYPDADLV